MISKFHSMKKNIVNMIYFINKYNEYGFIYEQIKHLYDDEKNAISINERNVKRTCNAFNFIFENMNQSFTEELITNAYYLLTYNILEETLAKEIISIYYQNIDNSAHYLSVLIHMYIMRNIKEKNVEFAFLISNYILYKIDKVLIMPYEFIFDEYRQAVISEDLPKLMRIFYEVEIINYEKRPCRYTKDEIILIIKKEKAILKEQFKIKKLYLFGSYAKKRNLCKSDIDLLVVFENDLINIERKELTNDLKEYLMKLYDCDVDLLDFSYALNTFDKSQMECIITLI